MSAVPWGRYAELRPAALDAIRAAAPVAYLPWGALAWHGPHLPLGVDGHIAAEVAERAARRTGGVLLPTTWWPVATLPHAASLSLPDTVGQALWGAIFAELTRAGWKVVVVLSGSNAQGHELVLMDAAEAAIKDLGLLVLAVPPLALVDEEMLDHAALWESSQMLALRPELVDLEALGRGPLRPAEAGVLGRDPRDHASASLGERALSLAETSIARAVDQLLAAADPAPLQALYAQRRDRYRAYLARYYRGSMERAVGMWWEEISQQ